MRTLACIAACLLAFPAFAGNYLEPADIPPSFLFKPWAEDSREWQGEIQEIAEMQKRAGAAEIKAAAREMEAVPEIITVALGTRFSREHCPVTFGLLDRLDDDMKPISKQAKEFWNTRRPYVAAAGTVKALIAPHANPAYPSGHTYKGLVWAEVLGQLLPTEREKLRAQLEQVAYHRVLAGMHYPVDIQGGRALARLTLGALWQNPKFRQDLEAVRKELAERQH